MLLPVFRLPVLSTCLPALARRLTTVNAHKVFDIMFLPAFSLPALVSRVTTVNTHKVFDIMLLPACQL